jgi:hypothetical protein
MCTVTERRDEIMQWNMNLTPSYLPVTFQAGFSLHIATGWLQEVSLPLVYGAEVKSCMLHLHT